MTELIPQLPAWLLISFGLVLMALEMFTLVFVLLFFGVAFVVVGLLSFFIPMPGEVQILMGMVIGGLLTFGLRRYMMQTIQTKDLVLETLKTGEIGILQEHAGELRVNYKGTTWAIHPKSNEEFKAGEKVIVSELIDNLAVIKTNPQTA